MLLSFACFFYQFIFNFTVYAIEASEMAEQTQKIIEENKMVDRIDVIHNVVEVSNNTDNYDPIIIYHRCEGGIVNPSRGSPIVITRLAKWWQTVITRDGFFYPILTLMDSFSCSPLNISFYIEKKTWKNASRKSWIRWAATYMWYGEVILTLQWRRGSTCSQRLAVRFLSFRVCMGYVR